MRINLLATSLVAGTIAIGIPPAQASTFGLFDALAVSYETNPQLASARAALEALDQGVAQADAGWRPSVNATGSYGTEHALVQGQSLPFDSHPMIGEVTVNQPIFRGGRTVAEISRAVALVRAGRAQLTSTEQAVFLAAVTAYMDVVRDAAIASSDESNVRTLEAELAAVRTELSQGDVTRTDSLQVEARLARARSDLAVAQARLAASRASFENVIGRPAETLDEDARLPPLPASSDTALSMALRYNPAVLEAKANLKAADYGVDDATGALLPEFSIAAQYQYLRDAAGTSTLATNSPQQVLNIIGQINIPIYQGGGDEATVRRAKDLSRKSEFDAITAERSVRQDVASAWQALGSERLALSASEAEVSADRAALDGVIAERRGGERSELDVLNAQQEYISAQIAVAIARHDLAISAYNLLSATGQLTAKYLGLKVKTYDPRTHFDDDAHAWFGFGD